LTRVGSEISEAVSGISAGCCSTNAVSVASSESPPTSDGDFPVIGVMFVLACEERGLDLRASWLPGVELIEVVRMVAVSWHNRGEGVK